MIGVRQPRQWPLLLAMALSLLAHGVVLFAIWMTLPRLLATGQAALEPLLVRLTTHPDSVPGEPATAIPTPAIPPGESQPPLTDTLPAPPAPVAVAETQPASTADTSQAHDAKSPVEQPAEKPRQPPAPAVARESPQASGAQPAPGGQLPHGQAPAAAASTANSGAARAQYLAAISACLARQQRYPIRARRMGYQGTATVAFVVGRTGQVGQLRILQSAGSADLDRAALKLVQGCAPFAPPPTTLGGELALELPVRYRLQ